MASDTLDISQQKTVARKAAFAARKEARNAANSAEACTHLVHLITEHPADTIVAGYMPIQTEIDVLPAMHRLDALGYRMCLPVIQGRGMPLLFREWAPDCAMIEGDFGALIPRGGTLVTPQIAIVPLVGFDRAGHRLGYGGGFYDRSLAVLRHSPDFLAVGFAFAGQELEHIPSDAYDQALDAIVTETGVHKF